jgi:hypothetical protein
MSMMRNFDNEDHTPSVPRQDHKMSQRSPTPVVPSQDKKIPSTPKYDQEPASVIPDFVKGKKMNVGSDPVGDETYRQAKAIAWELVGRTNETREKLLNEIMKLHTRDGIGFDVLAKACDLWNVAPAWNNGNSPGPSQLHVYVEQLTRPAPSTSIIVNGESRGQASYLGPNARFEGKHYETLEEFLAKSNAAG